MSLQDKYIMLQCPISANFRFLKLGCLLALAAGCLFRWRPHAFFGGGGLRISAVDFLAENMAHSPRKVECLRISQHLVRPKLQFSHNVPSHTVFRLRRHT
jgi:hypothetical protein